MEQQNSSNIYNNGSYIKINEDRMSAWLFLAETKEPYTKNEIYSFLHDHGVTMGYHSSNIAGMVKKHVYEREIKIAEGRTNENGQDGYFEYTFCPEIHKAPAVLADGRVDYESMNALKLVQKDEILAIYHKAVQGENGYTVTGTILPAVKAKELLQIPGQGVFIDPDTGLFKAELEGKVEVLDGRVDVRSVHVVNGDLDLITGRVDFNGDVVVKGNVETGVVINAARNIIVYGTVEAAHLTAGGDIILTGGIQGNQKGKLLSKGNIFADFIEHTWVDTEGTVMTNSIINSNIKAKKKVVLTGRRGSIIGGYVHGLEGVEATAIGNEAEVKTTIHAGFHAEDQKRFFILKKAELDMQQKLSDTLEELNTLLRNRKLSKQVNPALDKRIAELKEENTAYTKQISSIRKSKAAISALLDLGRGAKVVVDGNIYRGTVVSIDHLQKVMEHNTCYMKYFTMGGEIESNVIIK